MLTKIIKSSKRGLTFSFDNFKKLSVGSSYSYVIDRQKNKIHIIPDKNGSFIFSKKKSGRKEKALIDLRNKDVLALFEKAELLKVSIDGEEIFVEAYSEQKNLCSENNCINIESRLLKKNKVASIHLTKGMIRGYQMAVGAETQYEKFYKSIEIEDLYSVVGDSYATECIEIPIEDKKIIYNVVSLFSGAGIFDYPFATDPQFNINYAIDYSKDACMTYAKNIGNHIECGDVHKVDGTKFKNTHLLIGGPSCKPFSNANRTTRLADHKDSDLVNEYIRIASECHPEVFVMENVPAVLTASDGMYYESIKQELSKLGYDISHTVVTDCEVGGYTQRKRAIIIGSRIGRVSFPKMILKTGYKTVGDAFAKINASWSNLSDVTNPKPDTALRMSFVPQGGNYKDIPDQYKTSIGERHSNTYHRLCMNEPSRTLVNWRKPPIIHPLENRILSVAEAKALQGLPGYYEILGNSLDAKQQQVGNCVPVAMGIFVKQIVKRLLNQAFLPEIATA